MCVCVRVFALACLRGTGGGGGGGVGDYYYTRLIFRLICYGGARGWMGGGLYVKEGLMVQNK